MTKTEAALELMKIAEQRTRLLAELNQINHDKDKIELDLRQSRVNFAAYNERTDPGWYQRATAALCHKKRDMQRAQGALAALKTREKAVNITHSTLERGEFTHRFHRAAKLLLPTAEFARVSALAAELTDREVCDAQIAGG